MGHKKKFGFIAVGLVLAFVLILGAFIKIGNMETNKKLTISDYKIATINATDGKVNESNQNIITKDYLAVEGLELTLEEDATISIKVFYYDEDKKFLSSADTLKSVDSAKYVKVLITPALVDNEVVKVDILNMSKYVSQIKIVVAK